ncbi:hypothetical protein FRB96_008124 [Tulasnella sp. 330]|nr:hypothetical protein FRB96_008124 [Tulasnella sp. 330]
MEPANFSTSTCYHPPTPALPNEVLDLILKHCTRSTLYNCCLLDRNLYRLSVSYLYNDPFGRDQADHDFAKLLRTHTMIYRNAQLCQTISKNLDLADLVRTFRGFPQWDNGMGVDLVLPHLRNLHTADLRGMDVEPFISTCPSKELRRLRVGEKMFIDRDRFARWLQGQADIQSLHFRDLFMYFESPSITLPNLRILHASYAIAKSILPYSSRMLEFSSSIPEDSVSSLLDLLRNHCPLISSIVIDVHSHLAETTGAMDSHGEMMIANVHSFQHLEVLEMAFTTDSIDADPNGMPGFISRITGCPKLRYVGWKTREYDRNRRIKGSKDYSLVEVNGSWVVQ